MIRTLALLAAAVMFGLVTWSAQGAQAERPVLDSFGYGDLKLGMTRQEALDARLIGPAEDTGPEHTCTKHQILGTDQSVFVSTKLGVATIFFTEEMTATGRYPALTSSPEFPHTFEGAAPGNDKAFYFITRTTDQSANVATLNLKGQDCHT